ncbi:MAG: uracil-DNA glycosylase [Treponema sp.]|jgi:DNA polymerase|nr:uracil-DNA glycosylase [Treponema sp.]
MTAEEKKSVAFFIDLASGWTRGKYLREEREYCFSDDSDTCGGGAAIGGLEEAAPSAHRAPDPLVMVIGDVSDLGEDALLLDKMLGAIGLSRESNCFIANISKYRQSEDRDPQPDEITACAGFLESQIKSLKPRFILCLGEFPSRILLNSVESIEKLRGRLMNYNTAGMTIPLITTYHPNDLLRNGDLKRLCWADLKLLRASIAPASDGAQIVHGVKPC